MEFTKNFMLGSATAAHQVEGNNINSDGWAKEHMVHTFFKEPSLDAVEHYTRYRDDIRLLAEAGLDTYRFSIEWARIEPSEGDFREEEIEHYRDMLAACREFNITPVVTLHHFTSPKWFISKVGWEAEGAVEYFKRYCVYVIERLGSEMTYVCTLNEVNLGMQISDMIKNSMRSAKKNDAIQIGINADAIRKQRQEEERAETMEVFGVPEIHDFLAPKTRENEIYILKAHEAARDAIKAICPHLKVGLTLSLRDCQVGAPDGVEAAKAAWDASFIHYLPYIKDDDFIGVQNYTRQLYDKDGVMGEAEGTELTQMGYAFYPQGVSNVVRRVHKDFHGEILITENGIATDDDTKRVEFIRQALEGIQKCVNDGIPVVGYLYWSLLDNYEWQNGYSKTFGLIAVDRSTQIRTPKPSLEYIGRICREKNSKNS